MFGNFKGEDWDVWGELQRNIGQSVGGKWGPLPMITGAMSQIHGNRLTREEDEAQKRKQQEALAMLPMPTSLDLPGFANLATSLSQTPEGWDSNYWGAATNLMTAMGQDQTRQNNLAVAQTNAAGDPVEFLKELQKGVTPKFPVPMADGTVQMYAVPPGVNFEDIGKDARQREQVARESFPVLLGQEEVGPIADYIIAALQARGAVPYIPPEGEEGGAQQRTPVNGTAQPAMGIPNPNENRRTVTADGDIVNSSTDTVIPQDLYNRISNSIEQVIGHIGQDVQNKINSGVPQDQAVARGMQSLMQYINRLRTASEPYGFTPDYFDQFNSLFSNPDLFTGATGAQNQYRTGMNNRTVRVNDVVEFLTPDNQSMRGTIVGFQNNMAQIILDIKSLPDGGQSMLEQGINPQEPVLVPAYQLFGTQGQGTNAAPASP